VPPSFAKEGFWRVILSVAKNLFLDFFAVFWYYIVGVGFHADPILLKGDVKNQ